MQEAKSILLGSRLLVKFTTLQRFNQKWEPEPDSGCHIWNGSRCSGGYGNLKIGGKKGRAVASHRISWEIHRGPVPKGLCVLHRCDVKACVNPEHLFLGTQDDNMADMKRKGRAKTKHGVENNRAKLSENDIAEIRASSELRCVLAKRFGIARSTVSKIRVGTIWAHLPIASEAHRKTVRFLGRSWRRGLKFT